MRTVTTDPSASQDEQARELERDQRTEDRVFWKGVLALVITVLLALARQRWWQ